ncbi:MAG: hypothetical protein NUV75_14020 [Gallionella sp.]|nr:hypothetical protein [Gallionella sp.]
MTRKKITVAHRRTSRASVMLEIELPALSNEAAAAMADVLVQLYHRFEAAYYAQILTHHADQAISLSPAGSGRGDQNESADLF